ncbi:MAG: hypothetical protein AAFQ81_03025 [Pseudomonadota bacterium]
MATITGLKRGWSWLSQARPAGAGEEADGTGPAGSAGTLPPPKPFAPPHVPNPVYAIGPVRGEVGLLRQLVARILRDLPRRPSGLGLRDTTGAPVGRRQPVADLVLLGNLAAGGRDGLAVLDCIADIVAEPSLRLTLLRGPQEWRLCRLLAGECDGQDWLREGGISFLTATGIDPRLGGAPPRLRAEIESVLGPRRALLEGMPPSLLIGNMLFSHGGGQAAAPIEDQDAETLVLGAGIGRPPPRADGIWTVHAGPLTDLGGPRAGVLGLCTGVHYAQRLVALRIDTDGGLGLLEASEAPAAPQVQEAG